MLLKEVIKQNLTIKISHCLLRKIFQVKISSVFIEQFVYQYNALIKMKHVKQDILNH
jgi:hypothetical protein